MNTNNPEAIETAQNVEIIPTEGINLTVRDVQESTPALRELMAEKLRPLAAFRIKEFLRFINNGMKKFEDERVALCQSLGTINSETNQFEFTDENRMEFDRQFQDLLEMKINLPIAPLNLNDIKEARISVDALMMLDWLIVEK